MKKGESAPAGHPRHCRGAVFSGAATRRPPSRTYWTPWGCPRAASTTTLNPKWPCWRPSSARRAERKFTQAARELRASSLGALEKLNRLFSLVNIFEREQPEFVQVVLNVCFRGGDAALLRAIREVTLTQLGPLMDEVVVQGVREGVFYTRQLGGIGRLLLLLAHDVEDEAARLLIARRGASRRA